MVHGHVTSLVRTVAALDGTIVPTTIDQRTELHDISITLSVYHRLSGKVSPWETVVTVGDAMRDAMPIVVKYEHDDVITARVLWPDSITLTKENNIVCRAYCTYRRLWRTFRLDRFTDCHAFSTPDDVEPAA